MSARVAGGGGAGTRGSGLGCGLLVTYPRREFYNEHMCLRVTQNGGGGQEHVLYAQNNIT